MPSEATSAAVSTSFIRQLGESAGDSSTLTDEQRKRFAEAHYNAGLALLKKGRPADAEPHFREALRLWPAHARAMLRLGDAYAMRRELKAAAEAYARAAQLDPTLRLAVRQRRMRLARYCLAIADQRLADSRIAGARQVLEFVLTYLNDVGGEGARERLAQLEPLLRAEAVLNAARDDLLHHRQTAAYQKLRALAAKYPRSYFGQQANRLLDENGQKIVLDRTGTGYVLPRYWRRTSTAHFVIYYEKNAGLSGTKRYAEEAYARIVGDFGMADAQWKTRVTMYVFSDNDSWREFLAMNENRTMEWAGGFAVPEANEIYLYVTDRKSDLYTQVLPHELTHVLHYRYVGGIWQPLWLKEGLAVSQEKGGLKQARRAVDDMVKHGSAYTLRELFRLMYYPRRTIRLFYDESATVVGFMIKQYGVEMFKEFMFAFASTTSSQAAIQRVYGISLDSFEKKWEKYVR